MGHAFVGRALVVELDHVGGKSGNGAREQHDRHAGLRERLLQLRRQAARRLGQDDAVDAFGEKQAEVDLFLLEVVVAAGDQQGVAGGVRGVFGAAHHFGEERVGDVGHDHAEGLGALLGHAARQQVGLIAERFDRRLDAALQVVADERAVVEDRRHGGHRDAGTLGDVVDVRHAGCTRCVRRHSNTRSAAKRFARLKRLDIDNIGGQAVSLAKRFAVTTGVTTARPMALKLLYRSTRVPPDRTAAALNLTPRALGWDRIHFAVRHLATGAVWTGLSRERGALPGAAARRVRDRAGPAPRIASVRAPTCSAAIRTPCTCRPRTPFRIVARAACEIADARVASTQAARAARDPAGGLRLRDSRRRQRDPPDRRHRAAGVSRRPAADLRSVHAGRQLVVVSAAQARHRRSAARSRSRGDLLFPLPRSERIRLPARL